MRTTQKAFAALTAAATLIGLAACGGGSDNASKGSTGDANKAELVFWGWDTGHTMTNLIKDFQKANPGITVGEEYVSAINDRVSLQYHYAQLLVTYDYYAIALP